MEQSKKKKAFVFVGDESMSLEAMKTYGKNLTKFRNRVFFDRSLNLMINGLLAASIGLLGAAMSGNYSTIFLSESVSTNNIASVAAKLLGSYACIKASDLLEKRSPSPTDLKEIKDKICSNYYFAGRPFDKQHDISKDIAVYHERLCNTHKSVTASAAMVAVGGAIAQFSPWPTVTAVGGVVAGIGAVVGGTVSTVMALKAREQKKKIERSFENRYEIAKRSNFQTTPSTSLFEALNKT